MQAAPVSVLHPVARARFRTALVTSADSSFRQRVSEILTGLRWQVREAEGGAQAWSEAEAILPEAVIVDSWLPDLDLAEFLADFRGRFPQVDVLTADGSAAGEGPRGPYRQELLYALRRSQETDTAAWNTAPVLNNPALNNPALNSQVLEVPVPDNQGAARNGWIPAAMHGAGLDASAMNEDALVGHSLPASGPVAHGALASASGSRQHFTSPRALPAPEAGPPAGGAIARSLLGGPSPDRFSPPGASPAQASSQPSSQAPNVSQAGFAQHHSAQPPALRTGPARLGMGAGGGEQKTVDRLPELIGDAAIMIEVSRRIRLVSQRMTPVLIEGPTGSGKELVAEALHRLSARSRKPFVAINCAAIPEALLEAELFGHTRGAFTGAVQGRVGRIESADGGTLFLDEIGEMPLALQSKLLRFVESGELQRVGDNETVKVDVRIVAATHQPLADHTHSGAFRPDLYYRLAVFLIRTPSLTDHIEDLGLLVDHFLRKMGREEPMKRVDSGAMAKLAAHAWPGNVRELEHVLERAAILAGEEPVLSMHEIDFGNTVN